MIDVHSLFDAVADLPPAARESYYATHGVSPELRHEVESLLSFDPHASTFLMGGLSEAASGLAATLERPERCGPFRPVKLLGQGGMGAVWLAGRVDGEVDQSVAIKILRAGISTPRQRLRFIQERNILAALSHSGIARLLDAGQTDSGQPYLAMEYIDGQPIDRYCRNLDRAPILRTFLKVCAAVSYAHRNLVIHRDLKPSNILVTSEGEPKLLDFGIAKLMNLGAAHTTTMERALTPDYASPEQVTGRTSGTATDVYSLGAVLYKLLTGHTPHRFTGADPAGIAAVICEHPITPPSTYDKTLRGDLESILLKAMRKEPEERYISVDMLAADIENYLDHRPVQARQGHWLYRGRRFLRRHRLSVAAAAIAITGLAAGLYIAWQQRLQAEAARAIAESRRIEAQQQRDNATRERAIAVEQESLARIQSAEAHRQRTIAENRFQQVRQIAFQLMDLDKDLNKLNGATKARQTLVSTALSYLERLSAEAGGDTGFLLELAEAYRKVADIQAGPGSPNLAQVKEALASLGKAEKLLAAAPLRNPKVALALLDNLILQSRIQGSARDWEATSLTVSKGLRYANRATPESLDLLERKAMLAHSAQGVYVNLDRTDEAVAAGKLAVSLRRRIDDSRHSLASSANLATALLALASTYRYAGDLNRSLEASTEGRLITERRLNDKPDLATRRRLQWVLFQEARVLGTLDSISLGRWSEAEQLLERSLQLARPIAAADAEDVSTRHNLAMAAEQLALLRLDRDPASSLALYDEARARRLEIPASHPNHIDRLASQAGAVRALVRLGRHAEAATRLDQLFQDFPKFKLNPNHILPGNYAALALRAKADWNETTGDTAAATRIWRELAQAFEASPRKPEADLHWAYAFSEAYRALARLHESAGDADGAAVWQNKDRALWNRWDSKLPGNSFVQRQLRAAR